MDRIGRIGPLLSKFIWHTFWQKETKPNTYGSKIPQQNLIESTSFPRLPIVQLSKRTICNDHFTYFTRALHPKNKNETKHLKWNHRLTKPKPGYFVLSNLQLLLLYHIHKRLESSLEFHFHLALFLLKILFVVHACCSCGMLSCLHADCLCLCVCAFFLLQSVSTFCCELRHTYTIVLTSKNSFSIALISMIF